MSKDDFVNIIKRIQISYSEGEQNDITKSNIFPRILLFEYDWDFNVASGQTYNCLVTYQVSFFSKTPRDNNLLNLLKELKENNILFSNVKHEYVDTEGGYFHSYFSVEVQENILWMDN